MNDLQKACMPGDQNLHVEKGRASYSNINSLKRVLGDVAMELDRFLSRKEILIDDAGWGDLISGVVIGALKLPDRRYMERRIPIQHHLSKSPF